jgi:hypothetical protein
MRSAGSGRRIIVIWFFEKPGTEGLSVVNKVTWQKAGRVTEPGRYMFRYGWLTVTAEDLAIWQRFPEASFTLVNLPSSPDAPEEFHLGAFEIPAHPSSPSLDEH